MSKDPSRSRRPTHSRSKKNKKKANFIKISIALEKAILFYLIDSFIINISRYIQTHPGGQFTFRRAAFLTPLQSKVGLVLAKAEALRINLDGTPIVSKSHSHPSHSPTSRLLTSSLSLGVPVPRPTQCVRDT